jgi:hypothetical protein
MFNDSNEKQNFLLKMVLANMKRDKRQGRFLENWSLWWIAGAFECLGVVSRDVRAEAQRWLVNLRFWNESH